MTALAVTNTFADGNTITAAGPNTNFSDIVNYVNNRNDGSATWDALRVTTSSAVVAILNNSSGSSNILNCQDNGTNVFSVADGGATAVTATAGGSSVALTVNNNTSTGSIFIAQDNGSAIMTIADGGALTYDGAAVFNEAGADKDFRIEGDANANLFFVDASADTVGFGHASPTATIHVAGGSGTTVAARVNNGTSTGNILELEDNGTDVLVVADGGIVTMGSQSAARAYRNTSAQAIGSGAATKVQLNAESFDIKSEFDSATNYRFTATVTGVYQVSAAVYYAASADSGLFKCLIYKNGSEISSATMNNGGLNNLGVPCSDLVQLSATDYIELYAYQDSGNSVNASNGASKTFLSVIKVA